MKEELLKEIERLKVAIMTDNIDELIKSIDKLQFDTRFLSPIISYTQDCIIRFIMDYMRRNNKDTLRVTRHNEYHDETFDVYKVAGGKLLRNGSSVIFTSLGKLYKAYKFCKNETN